MGGDKQERGVIPAGTRISIFGCSFTLKHNTEVLESQEMVDEEISRLSTYKDNGNLILSESLKNTLESEHP